MDWEELDGGSHRYTLPGAGFNPPERLRRPADQDQTLPYETDYPAFRCWVTTVRLPAPGDTEMWRYHAAPVNRSLGGVAYWRQAGLTGNVMRTVMSRRVLLPEVSAAQAAELNRQIPGFDNDMSSVYDQPLFKGRSGPRTIPRPLPTIPTGWRPRRPAPRHDARCPAGLAGSGGLRAGAAAGAGSDSGRAAQRHGRAGAVVRRRASGRSCHDPRPGRSHTAPGARQRARRARVGATEPLGFRHVRLACGNVVLSDAQNWFVPARLPRR
jgi:hypothetical protein